MKYQVTEHRKGQPVDIEVEATFHATSLTLWQYEYDPKSAKIYRLPVIGFLVTTWRVLNDSSEAEVDRTRKATVTMDKTGQLGTPGAPSMDYCCVLEITAEEVPVDEMRSRYADKITSHGENYLAA
jgi:hypothetical protein